MTIPNFDASVSVLGKIWSYRPHDSREALRISQIHNESELISRFLSGRGVTAEQTHAFLNPTLKNSLPDPSHLLDMDKAVQHVIDTIARQETIAIFGDYDVDGATSCALLYRFLTDVYKSPLIYIPDRVKEGYGPNIHALRKLKNDGASLVITVDCGTTAFSCLEQATQEGLNVIVLDHHTAEMKLPKITAIVNPNRQDQESSCQHLAAVGISFLFVVALNRAMRKHGFYAEREEPNVLKLLDLVALGTVCDVVPLIGLNRAFVAQGLKVMAARQNLGLEALCSQCGLDSELTPYHLGFILGPRINAGGRVGQSSLGAQILTTDDSFEAHSIAQKLTLYNEERRQIEAEVLEEAIVQATSQTLPFICVAKEGWHPGVIGIVAGRLKDQFHKPTAVITFDNGVGKASVRSIAGFDIGSAIRSAIQKGMLIEGGGHPMAGGFSIYYEQLESFRFFISSALNHVDLRPRLLLENDLSINSITVDFIKSLEKVGPYGAGNSIPKFMLSDARIKFVEVIGHNHIKCTLQNIQGSILTALAFRSLNTPLGEVLLKSKGISMKFAGTLNLNNWAGQERPQFFIEDVRI